MLPCSPCWAGRCGRNICYNRTHYTAEFYQIHSRKLTQSCRVVFLTDLHLREYGADNCELVQDVRSLAPDLILLGGDFVTYGEGTDYDNMLSLFRQLSEIAPVCGVLGNHEDELYFLDNDRELVEKVHRRRGDRPAQSGERAIPSTTMLSAFWAWRAARRIFSNYGASTFDGQRGAADRLRPAHLSGTRSHLLSRASGKLFL